MRWIRRARDLGHFDNLHGNREIQDPQGVCNVSTHLRHRKIKNLHQRCKLTEILNDVPHHLVLPATSDRGAGRPPPGSSSRLKSSGWGVGGFRTFAV